MKTFFICCFTFVVFSIPAYSQISADNEGQSPIVMTGGTAGINIPQALFYSSINTTLEGANKKNGGLFGFEASAKNRSGISDFIANGLTASKMQLGVNIGGYFDNEYARRFSTDKAAYLAKLNAEKEAIETILAPNFYDSVFQANMRRNIFIGKDSVGSEKMWAIFQRNSFHVGQTLTEWADIARNNKLLREYVKFCEGEIYAFFIPMHIDVIELKNIQEQINVSNPAPAMYRRFSLTFTPSVSYMAINYTGAPDNSNNYQYDTSGHYLHKTNFNIKLALNWNLNKQWHVGFSLGTSNYDNFYALNKVRVDSVNKSSANAGQTLSYTTYTGNYKVFTGAQVGFSAAYVHNFYNKNYVIYTPLYFNIGPLSNFGTSLSVLLKNNLSMGINLEAIVYNDGGAPGITAQRNMFGFNIRYLLADLDFE